MSHSLTFLASLAASGLGVYLGFRLVRYLVFTPRRCWLMGHRLGLDNYWLRGTDGDPLALIHQCEKCGCYVVALSAAQNPNPEIDAMLTQLRERAS